MRADNKDWRHPRSQVPHLKGEGFRSLTDSENIGGLAELKFSKRVFDLYHWHPLGYLWQKLNYNFMSLVWTEGSRMRTMFVMFFSVFCDRNMDLQYITSDYVFSFPSLSICRLSVSLYFSPLLSDYIRVYISLLDSFLSFDWLCFRSNSNAKTRLYFRLHTVYRQLSVS